MKIKSQEAEIKIEILKKLVEIGKYQGINELRLLDSRYIKRAVNEGFNALKYIDEENEKEGETK